MGRGESTCAGAPTAYWLFSVASSRALSEGAESSLAAAAAVVATSSAGSAAGRPAEDAANDATCAFFQSSIARPASNGPYRSRRPATSRM
jgi:hypothetical protein